MLRVSASLTCLVVRVTTIMSSAAEPPFDEEDAPPMANGACMHRRAKGRRRRLSFGQPAADPSARVAMGMALLDGKLCAHTRTHTHLTHPHCWSQARSECTHMRPGHMGHAWALVPGRCTPCCCCVQCESSTVRCSAHTKVEAVVRPAYWDEQAWSPCCCKGLICTRVLGAGLSLLSDRKPGWLIRCRTLDSLKTESSGS